MTADVLRLSVPARSRYLSTVRLAAAAAGAEAGLAVDALDDVRLAVSELAGALVEGADDPGVTLSLEFEVADARLAVRGELSGPLPPEPLDDLTRRIVAAVTDEHDVNGGAFRFVKHAR